LKKGGMGIKRNDLKKPVGKRFSNAKGEKRGSDQSRELTGRFDPHSTDYGKSPKSATTSVEISAAGTQGGTEMTVSGDRRAVGVKGLSSGGERKCSIWQRAGKEKKKKKTVV